MSRHMMDERIWRWLMAAVVSAFMWAAIAAALMAAGCSPGMQVQYEEDVRLAPTIPDTLRTADVVAARWPEMRPAVSESKAAWDLSQVTVVYSRDPAKFPLPAGLDGNALRVEGWQYGKLVYIRVDQGLYDVRTNALVHELAHVLLWGNGEDGDHDPVSHVDGPAWTPEMYGWVESVQGEL